MLKNYYQQAKLPFPDHITQSESAIVETVFAKQVPLQDGETIEKLYTYPVPKMSVDGSCSILEEQAEASYNLASTFGIAYDYKTLKDHAQSKRLWHLDQVISALQQQTKADWLGVYRKIKKLSGEEILVKEAYTGIFSRAEFPLTQEFAQKSNNSTVGLSGKAVLIADVFAHAGPYYKCDGKVRSEFCAPIFHNNKIIGIIDAEAFEPNFFTEEKVYQIAAVCHDLGEINLGI